MKAIAQSDLPGFVMIPRSRLRQLETVARASYALLEAAGKVVGDLNLAGTADKASVKLKADLDVLVAMCDLRFLPSRRGASTGLGFVSVPILFGYRHSVELFLKRLLGLFARSGFHHHAGFGRGSPTA